MSLLQPHACRLCQSPDTRQLLDFGLQPLCNHYLSNAHENEATYPFALSVCHSCGVIQFTDPPPLAQLADHPDWITYREAERHLEDVVKMLLDTTALSPTSKVRGLSFKDAPLLNQLALQGVSDQRLYRPEELGLSSDSESIELLQAALNPVQTAAILATDGPCDLLIVRHILEHAQNLQSFMTGLQCLLKPDGILLVELPDSSRSLAGCDYSMPWEEHVFYFTPDTLQQVWNHYGWRTIAYRSYTYLPEDVQVAILRSDQAACQPVDIAAQLTLATDYATGFASARQTMSDSLRRYQGEIGLLGGGHLGCTFINLLGLADLISCVIDDDPNKQGLFMPGSHLPIVTSEILTSGNLGLCLLSINPESEARVIERFAHLQATGTTFASIFPGSQFKLKTGSNSFS